jgi:hypothetical protein
MAGENRDCELEDVAVWPMINKFEVSEGASLTWMRRDGRKLMNHGKTPQESGDRHGRKRLRRKLKPRANRKSEPSWSSEPANLEGRKPELGGTAPLKHCLQHTI